MRVRIAPFVIGAMVVASVASAQTDSTRKATSTRRIPISKEAGGEVAPARVDTVTVYKTDTVTVYQRDTLTVTRVDTVNMTPTVTTTTPMPLALRRIGGFYIGIDAGAAMPSGDALKQAQNTGWHADVPFGWDPIGSPLGVRFAAGYTRFGRGDAYNTFANSYYNPTTGTYTTSTTTYNNVYPQIWQGDADLKLRLPATSLWSRRFEIYGLGGATYNRYRGLLQYNTTLNTYTLGSNSGTTTTIYPTVVDNSWQSAWGWNAGGGLQFGFGRTNLFAEARYIHFSNGSALNQIPVVVGLSWY